MIVNWLGRTLILVVAALVVSGIAYGIVQSSGDSAGQPAFEGREEFRPSAGIEGEGTGRPSEQGDFPGGARGGREGFNLNGIDQVLRPFIIIAAIVVVIAPIIALLKKCAPQHSKPTPV
jgi:hypothetical protein